MHPCRHDETKVLHSHVVTGESESSSCPRILWTLVPFFSIVVMSLNCAINWSFARNILIVHLHGSAQDERAHISTVRVLELLSENVGCATLACRTRMTFNCRLQKRGSERAMVSSPFAHAKFAITEFDFSIDITKHGERQEIKVDASDDVMMLFRQ